VNTKARRECCYCRKYMGMVPFYRPIKTTVVTDSVCLQCAVEQSKKIKEASK